MSDDDERLRTRFEPGPDGGMVCLTCRCLVRAGHADLKVHLSWHDQLDRR